VEDPQAPQSPADFPSYIVRPQESINPFGKSTIGGGGFEKKFGREEESTLGVQNKRRSNVELNQPPPKAEQAPAGEDEETEGEEAAGETEETVSVGEETEGGEAEAAGETSGAAPTGEGKAEESISESPTSTSKIGSVYRWTDENGVMHFTNNVGSVPEQYMDQIINQGGGKKEEIE